MREKHFLIIAASIGSGHIKAAEAVGAILSEGTECAMSRYNG